MLSVVQRSSQTVDHYSRQSVMLIGQFQKENPYADPRGLPIVLASEWYLGSHGRWSDSTVRIYGLSLEQELMGILEYDTVDPDSREARILQRLRNDRPASIKKAKRSEKENVPAHYSNQAIQLISEFQREHPDADQRTLPIIQATTWFLNSPGRWTAPSVKVYALALQQEITALLEFDAFDPDSPEGQLLTRLEQSPPEPSKKSKKSKKEKAVAHQKNVAAKEKKAAAKRKKRRKSLPMKELRGLLRYFRSREDEFSLWIAGYIIIASRLGWRPGEIINSYREGAFILSAAEKNTNNRGLTSTCEVDISAYFEKASLIKSASLASMIDRWMADAQKWKAYYGGQTKLLANINGRLATACKKVAIDGRLATASKKVGIKRVCTYTFRHFAISCMKASNFTCADIAVIVNHASNRTATEHYGKRQHGVKRPKKMLGFDPLRVHLVRNLARSFERPSVLAEQPPNEVGPSCQLEEALVVEIEPASQFSF